MPDLGEGAVFAGHRIDGVAGRGGMGTVYRATHIALDHMVALKVIAADLADDDSFRERFKSESRIAVSLRHPNVVPIHHAGEEQGLLFVTMDLIDGPDLRKLLLARGPLEPAEAISILEQVASALDVAHSRGLVHRDIKPGNILIESRAGAEHVYLTDFGLTKRMDQATEVSALTSTGAFVGTLDYVAPEQIRGERLDARTDVYALGCVLYEMLAGRTPFGDREEKVAKMYGHLQDVPTPLEGRLAALDDVVSRAISKQPDDRYPSAGDLARAASAASGGGPVAEAERSVATGPAAPTMAYAVPTEQAPAPESEQLPPPEEKEEEAPPPAPEPTVESEPPSRTPAAETDGPGARPTVEVPAAAAARSRRPRAPLLAGLAILLAAGIAATLLLSGGDGGPTSTSQAVGTLLPPPDEVPGGKLPVGVAVAGDSVYVADRDGGQLLVGDASTFESRDQVDLPGSPEDVIVSDGSVWVTVPDAGKVVRAPTSDVTELTEIEVGVKPSGIAAGEGSIWVTNFGSGNVSRIDPQSNSVETVPIDAQSPHGIAVADGVLWITDRSAGRLIRHEIAGGAADTTIRVGENPKGVAVAGGVVWVANADSESVSLIDEANSKAIDRRVEVGGQPRAVEVLAGKVWVSNGDVESKALDEKRGWVSAFDVDSREAEGQVGVGGSPEGLGVGSGKVWVATGPDGVVRAIEPG